MKSPLTAEEEFWLCVDVRDMRECWRWRDSEAYGAFTFDGETIAAHRFAWTCTYGPIPRGLLVLHGCDNAWCVNPRHLRLGTIEDNARDKAVLTRAQEAIASARRKQAAPIARTPRPVVAPLAFGATVKRLRETKGWSLRRFATEVGSPPSCVSNWENGHGGTPISNLPHIATVLECEIEDLVGLSRRASSDPIHERLLILRKRAQLTQSAVAAALGISNHAVCKWETGNARPDLGRVTALADLYGVSVEELINGVESAS